MAKLHLRGSVSLVTKGDMKALYSGCRIARAVITAVTLSVLIPEVPAAAQSELPSGVGWHALPDNTSLQGSGECPPDYFDGDSYYFNYTCSVVIRGYSGAIADTTANRLLIWGGGGNSYYGNELFSLNLDNNPVTLTRLSDPTVPSNFSNRVNCVESLPPGSSGNAPNSRSTFGGIVFLPGSDSLLSVGGSLACSNGTGTRSTWTLPLSGLPGAAPSWQQMDPTLQGTGPGASGGNNLFGMIADFDPNSGLVFVSDSQALYTYNPVANSYNGITPLYGFSTTSALFGGIDPVRKLFVAIGNCSEGSCSSGNGVMVADISNPTAAIGQNWTVATLADPNCAEFLAGGSNPLTYGARAPGLTYDTVAQTFVGWPNEGNSVYILTPDVANQRFTCQKQTFSGGPPNSAHQGANSTNGTYGRFRYFPGPDVFVLVNDYNIPAYILRLRDNSQSVTTSPASITFSSQAVSTSSSPASATLTNSGASSVAISSIAVVGDYSQTNNCGASLAPGGSCTISVTFSPTASGTRAGVVTIADTAGSGQQTISLQGTGTPPPYAVAIVTPPTLAFNDQALGTNSNPQTVSLSNQGGVSMGIINISVSGDYVQTNNCGSSLGAGQSCQVTVSFSPSHPGSDPGSLTIEDTDHSSASQSVGLSGSGVTLSSIAMTPANALLIVGSTLQFKALATYSDASTQDVSSTVTWAVTPTSVATINGTGLAQAAAPGNAMISATLSGISGTTALTVNTSTLPTGVGWHLLAASTALMNSGACPPDYFGGDAYYFNYTCPTVIEGWNGAIADLNANRLLVWGGGHTNYYGNEIFSLNLTANPVTLTRVKDPTVPSNFLNNQNCVVSIPPGQPDFAANSRETYGGLAYIASANVMYAFAGSLACTLGTSGLDTWTIPLGNLSSSTQWQHMDPTLTLQGAHPGATGSNTGLGAIADYDPNSGLVFVADGDALYNYSYTTNTYTQMTPHYGFWISEALYGGIDPVRKLFIAMGNCPGGSCSAVNGVIVADISNLNSTTEQNWTAATLADPNCAEFLAGGANEIPSSEQYPAITYDTVANTFVGWPNEGNSIYIMTPDVANERLTCQKLTFAGGPPNASHRASPNTTNGTFGRFRYFPALDAFVLMNDPYQPAYVLRLR